MKLGDGRKVTMHWTPDCEERGRLAGEASRLLAEWLECQDALKMVPKEHSDYEPQMQASKSAKRNLDAANRRYSQHVHERMLVTVTVAKS